jgi:WD40 repeat protein
MNVSKHILRLPLALLSLPLLLIACSGGTPPESSFEYAVQGLYSAELSDNGSLAIVGSINHGSSLWRASDNARRFNWNHKQGQFSEITNAAFSPDLNYAITATPQTMVLWNAKNGASMAFWTAPSEILDISLLPNAQLALLGLADHTAALFDVRNGGVQQVFYHQARVSSVDFNSRKKLVLTGSDDYSAKLWHLQTAKLLHHWPHKAEVQLVKLSPNGKLAFTMAKYDKAALWDTTTGKSKGEIPLATSALSRGLSFTAVAFSSNGDYLLTGTSHRIVQLWDTKTLTEIKRWIMPKRDAVAPTNASVLALAFNNGESANASYRVMTSDGFIHQLQ